jgi:hypothetical protein
MTVGLDKSGYKRKALLTQLKRNGLGEPPKAEKQTGLPMAPRMTGTRKQMLRVAVNLTAAAGGQPWLLGNAYPTDLPKSPSSSVGSRSSLTN